MCRYFDVRVFGLQLVQRGIDTNDNAVFVEDYSCSFSPNLCQVYVSAVYHLCCCWYSTSSLKSSIVSRKCESFTVSNAPLM